MYCENSISFVFKQPVQPRDVYMVLARFFNYSMLRDPDLKATHRENEFKFFTFSAPFPFQVGQDYPAQQVLLVRLRSVSPEWMDKMSKAIERTVENDQLCIHSQQVTVHEQNGLLHSIKTVNPTFVTIKGRPWMPETSEQLLIEQLHTNSEHKFRTFLELSDQELKGLTSGQTFIEHLERLNRTPIKISFKKGTLLGHKYRIHVRHDRYSQTLAKFILGAGLGEKTSSIGGGFCIPG